MKHSIHETVDLSSLCKLNCFESSRVEPVIRNSVDKIVKNKEVCLLDFGPRIRFVHNSHNWVNNWDLCSLICELFDPSVVVFTDFTRFKGLSCNTPRCQTNIQRDCCPDSSSNSARNSESYSLTFHSPS